jgi:tRNA-dihydrouridine synthase
MEFYQAPLEGITGNIFRTAQHRHFGGVDKYFTPFISPTEKGALRTRIKRDILPENNSGQRLIPQILTNSAEGFLTMCDRLEEYGYEEFNLNLGCPSGTVVSKGRGAGFLKYTDELDSFLEAIFKSKYGISVKTRLGVTEPEEFYRLIEIYNRYPMTELIVHPRTREDMYNGKPNLDMYAYAQANCRHKLCYNGNIFNSEAYNAFTSRFPSCEAVMLGRGLVINPALPSMLKGAAQPTSAQYRAYYYEITEEYKKILSGDTHLLFKTKEILLYMAKLYSDNERVLRRIKKAKRVTELNSAADELFNSHSLKPDDKIVY